MQNQLLQTFCTFVKIDSPTGSECNFSNFLKKKLTRLGVQVSQDKRGNLFATFNGKGNPILLVAHIDTVEPGRGITPYVKNGIIKSKGETILGADNKATVAVLFEIMRWAQIQKIHGAFEVLLSVSEESGISGIETFAIKKIRSKQALCFDIAKPFGTIVLDSPFYLYQDIRFQGREAAVAAKTCHSVIPALIDFLKKIPQGIHGDTSFNIGVIRGGNATNSLLSNIRLHGEIRSFVEKDIKKYSFLTQHLIKKISKKNNCSYRYIDRLENRGYHFNSNDQFLKFISNIIYQNTHYPVKYFKKYWGVSDANNLNQKGIKTLNLGYGAKNPHTVKESISIREMEKVFKFLQIILTRNMA